MGPGCFDTHNAFFWTAHPKGPLFWAHSTSNYFSIRKLFHPNFSCFSSHSLMWHSYWFFFLYLFFGGFHQLCEVLHYCVHIIIYRSTCICVIRKLLCFVSIRSVELRSQWRISINDSINKIIHNSVIAHTQMKFVFDTILFPQMPHSSERKCRFSTGF